MKKTFCDRCNKEIITRPESNVIFPIYDITAIYDVLNIFSPIKIDLCPNCQKSFYNWINNKET